MSSPLDFLKHKYGEEFEGVLSLWTKQNKHTTYFSSKEWDALAQAIEEFSPTYDVYVALATQQQRLSTDKRGTADSVVTVPGCFADIDFANEKLSSKRYPKDIAEARTILESFAVRPTTIIKTGHGIHLHFDFSRPVVVKTSAERVKIKRLAAAFQRELRNHFRRHDRDIDSVGDLCRLYRIPGTLNHKTAPPKTVETISDEQASKYSIEFYEDFVSRTASGSTIKAARRSGDSSHDTILAKCGWYRDVVEKAASCDEPNWYAAASITSRCHDGRRIFHEYSAKHPKYDKREADQKFQRALTEAGPRTCAAIEQGLGFTGCAACPFRGTITSPLQLGRPHVRGDYQAGHTGPLVLGYVGGEFVFRNQQTQELGRKSSIQLSMAPTLLELAPKHFWESAYPRLTTKGAPIGVDWLAACDGLIQACRSKGAIEISSIRGIGVWKEEKKLIINLGGETIESKKYIYSTPKRVTLRRSVVPIDAIKNFLRQFNWTTANAPELLLGWAFASVICGALRWRPHAGVTGPAQAGKSTVLRGLGYVLSPLALIKEGISTEAGIRQSIGYDARPVLLDELEPESASDRWRVARIVKLMRSSSGAVGSVARGTPEGRAINFSTQAMFLIGAINLYRISAADTSRLMKFELKGHDGELQRRSNADILRLLEALEDVGPAFCQLAIDHAADVLESIDLIHAALPVVQERQADNMATVLAGYWVAINQRRLTQEEVDGFVEPFSNAVAEQKEGVELDDATECLNVLLGTSVFVTREGTNNEGDTFSHKETEPLGVIIANAHSAGATAGEWIKAMEQHGIKLDEEGFLVANSHPGLDRIFRSTRWEGKLWGSALGRLDGARRTAQRRFSDGVRSLATWIPSSYLPPPNEDELVDR